MPELTPSSDNWPQATINPPSSGGVTVHGLLTGRDEANQHSIGAVTGLQAALDALVSSIGAKAAQSALDALSLIVAGKADTSHTHNASALTAGILDPARLATGTPNGSKFLRDDGSWATPAGSTPPSGAWTLIESATLNNATDYTFSGISTAYTELRLRWKDLRFEGSGTLTRNLTMHLAGVTSAVYHWSGWTQQKQINTNGAAVTTNTGSGTSAATAWQIGYYVQGGTVGDAWSFGEIIVTQSPDRTRPMFTGRSQALGPGSGSINRSDYMGWAEFASATDLTSLTVTQHSPNTLTGTLILEGRA